jgi:hypothetical protein
MGRGRYIALRGALLETFQFPVRRRRQLRIRALGRIGLYAHPSATNGYAYQRLRFLRDA